MKPLNSLKPLRSFWIKEALGLTLALESGKGLEARVRSILDTSRSRELLTRRALLGIGLGTAASVSLVALMAPKRSLPGKGKPIPADSNEPKWPAEVRGRVLLPDGSPAAKAAVWLQVYDRHKESLESLGVTGTDGSYRFPVTKTGERFTVLVTKEGFGLAGTHRAEVTLTLSKAVQVQLIAKDETGAPLQNVELSVATVVIGKLGGVNRFSTLLSNLLTTRTDAQGRAVFTGLPWEGVIRLKANDLRYSSAEGQVNLNRNTDSVNAGEIVFARAVAVSGRVVGPEGKPYADVRVGAQGTGANNGWADARTDAQGNYQLTQLAPGTYNIALDLPDRSPWTASAHENVVLHSQKNLTGLNFTLERGCLISGRVLGADDRPIVGYPVGVYGPAHPKSSAWVQATKTDSAGRYQLRVPAGEQYLYLQGGDPPLGYTLPKEKGHTFTLAKNASRTKDFILPTTEILPPVTGTVRDASGAPVAGAILRVEGKEFEDSFAFLGMTTDTTGRFSLPLRTRKPFTVTAESHGRYSERIPIAPGQELTLSLTKMPGVLTGAVVAPDGAPLAGIPVLLSRSLGGLGYSQPEGETTTDATGHYRFSGLRPGERYLVGVGKEGKYGISANRLSETVKIPSGTTVTLKPITLRRGQ